MATTRARVSKLLEKSAYPSLSDREAKQSKYTLSEVASFLQALGSTQVYTNLGAMPASSASKLVLSGTVKEVVVPGVCTIKCSAGWAVSSKPLSSVGVERGELTYTSAELERARLADLALHMGLDASTLVTKVLEDPAIALAETVEFVESKRTSPLYSSLKSNLINLAELVTDVVSTREGDRSDTLSAHVLALAKYGEFEEVGEHAKHRLHVTRSLERILSGNTRMVYKMYTTHGKHYVVVFDKSGSMRTSYSISTRKAFATVVALLLAKADPEARFSAVVFDAVPRVLVREGSPEELAGALLELEPGGGTSYARALKVASDILTEGDVLVVIGDFEDTVPPDNFAVETIRRKASKVFLIPTGEANVGYLSTLANLLGAKVFVYRSGAFVEKNF